MLRRFFNDWYRYFFLKEKTESFERLHFLKRYCVIIVTIASIFQIKVLNASGLAIIGGTDNNFDDPYVALVSLSGEVSALTGETPVPMGQIYSVAINSSGMGIIGGWDNNIGAYVALVTPSGMASKLTGETPLVDGQINSVAINSFGTGIIGGYHNGGLPYAALVTPSGVASKLTGADLPIGDGGINSVAINSSGAGIIGGYDNGSDPYVALVTPSGEATALTGTDLPSGFGEIRSVGINISGAGIIGGFHNTSKPYVAIVSPSGVATALTGPNLPSGDGQIFSVAINSSGVGIIGGNHNSTFPYVALVSPSGAASFLTGTDLPSGNGFISSVAINSSGAGIIGGQDNTTLPYVALVSPIGEASKLTGPGLPSGDGVIRSVAISPSGVGIIGGVDEANTHAYMALVSPSGVATSLSSALPMGLGALPVGNGTLYSVGIGESGIGESILSLVDPKGFGPGNAFADPVFALSTTVLENHLRSSQKGNTESSTGNNMADLSADAQDIIRPTPFCQDSHKYVLWASPFGFYAHQKETDSFPNLRDRGFGGIIGFDYVGWEGIILGGGGAYVHQNIGYFDNFGKARVDQGFLTLYSAWHKKNIAIQGALWGGRYHMDNRRKTLGFITSTSDVNGWIFSPHIEISTPFNPKDKKLTIEPFVMFDWVNNWQGPVNESGKAGFNIRIDRHYVSLLRSEVGLHILESFQLKNGDLTFEESFSYVNKTPFNAKRRPAFYVGSISTFNLQMFSNKTVNQGAIRLAGRFTPCKLKHPYIDFIYQGEFGPKLLSHTFALEVGKRF